MVTVGEERKKCKEPRCITILSTYNDNKYCFYHHAVKRGQKAFEKALFLSSRDVGANVDRFFLRVIAEYEGWR